MGCRIVVGVLVTVARHRKERKGKDIKEKKEKERARTRDSPAIGKGGDGGLGEYGDDAGKGGGLVVRAFFRPRKKYSPVLKRNNSTLKIGMREVPNLLEIMREGIGGTSWCCQTGHVFDCDIIRF